MSTRTERPVLRRLRELDTVVTFIAVTVAFSLISAAFVLHDAEALEPDAGVMLRASAVYAAVLGWQPLAALAVVRLMYDAPRVVLGLRPIALRTYLFAVVVALFVSCAAFALDTVLDLSAWNQTHRDPIELSGAALVRLPASFIAIVAILWFQAIVEELAWRGYVLPKLMRTMGAWPGLIVHGCLWGLSYWPVFAARGATVSQSVAFVVTAVLLGVVLGWLRLLKRSIHASAACNAMLTICGGLPVLLLGDGSRYSAAFGPAGWIAMLAVIVVIVCYRPWRQAISTPRAVEGT